MEKVKIEKQEDGDFFLKNGLWLLMAATSIMLFLCISAQNVVEWKDLIIDFSVLQILTLVMIVVFSFLLNIGDSVCFSMFLSLFSNVGYVFIVGSIACLINVLIRFIIDVSKKKKQVHIAPLAIVVGFMFVFLLVNYGFLGSGITIGFMIIYVAALLYLLFENKDDINISKCFTAVFFALLVSLAITSILKPQLGVSIYDSYIGNKRIRLFAYHTNFLSMHAMFQIAFSVYSIFNKKRSFETDMFAIIISFYLGLKTKSKAFFLIVVIIIVYLVICSLKKYKSKSIIFIISMFIILMFGIWISRGYVISIFQRFLGNNEHGSGILSKITTGRYDIWQIYMKDWLFNPTKIMFGAGIFTDEPYYQGIHNTYLFILYRFGIVGLAFIIIASVYILKKCKFSFTIEKFIILAIWLLLALEEVVLSDQFAIYLILGIIMIMKPKEEYSKENIETKQIIVSKSCKKKSNNIK